MRWREGKYVVLVSGKPRCGEEKQRWWRRRGEWGVGEEGG